MRLLTKKEKEFYEGELEILLNSDDNEISHGTADDILCKILTKMGYKKIVTIFNKLEKWYA